jgi:hypothetical protein
MVVKMMIWDEMVVEKIVGNKCDGKGVCKKRMKKRTLVVFTNVFIAVKKHFNPLFTFQEPFRSN